MIFIVTVSLEFQMKSANASTKPRHNSVRTRDQQNAPVSQPVTAQHMTWLVSLKSGLDSSNLIGNGFGFAKNKKKSKTALDKAIDGLGAGS